MDINANETKFIFDPSTLIHEIDSNNIFFKTLRGKFKLSGEDIVLAIHRIISYFQVAGYQEKVLEELEVIYKKDSISNLISFLIFKGVLISEDAYNELFNFYLEKYRYFTLGGKTLKEISSEMKSMTIGLICTYQFAKCFFSHFENERMIGSIKCLIIDRANVNKDKCINCVEISCLNSSSEVPIAETRILPSAQMLLLYFIYHGCEELLTGDAARALSLTATSVSRASGQLQEFGLVKTEKRGVHKVLLSDMTSRELFEKSEKYLMNPIKRIIYVRKEEIREEPLMSGYTALSEYSMLNPSSVQYFATESISKWEKSSTKRLQNSDDQYAIELWRYDPKRLSHGKCVDKLSLALALREDQDERIQEAVEEMLMKLWGDIHDKRN